MTNIKENILQEIANIVHSETKIEDIKKALHILINGNYVKYSIDAAIEKYTTERTYDLSKLNEYKPQRKATGAYYTPEDVATYIIYNAIITKLKPQNDRTYRKDIAVEELLKNHNSDINSVIKKMTFFDPTCGAGQFLLDVAKVKIELLNKSQSYNSSKDILDIAKTIFGNDIDDIAIDITKIRLFAELKEHLSKLKYAENLIKLAEIISKQFFIKDFVDYNKSIEKQFDIIVGNPPYIEYSKYYKEKKTTLSYGNVYANVIQHSIDCLVKDGVLGLVIPLSYTSTARMQHIRNFVISHTEQQVLLNFADRPDCLFQGVHQKLNILIAKKGKSEHKLYTSNYKHWYSTERQHLLNGCEIHRCLANQKTFLPKIGNGIEESIYEKISTETINNIFDSQSTNDKVDVFLNMRACFWIKAFSTKHISNEYKMFTYEKSIADFVICLLNSSLYWVYWTIVSDCWHLTTKELKGFYLPTKIENLKNFSVLRKQLEVKLDKTKKYVGTKQTDYEYKHKECIDIIDFIDDELAKVYKLTKKELDYVKSFARKYRLGGGE